MKYGEPFRVDAAMLAQSRASRVLAVRPEFFGSLLALPEAVVATELRCALDGTAAAAADAKPSSSAVESSQVAIVAIDGPLSQRGEAHMCGVIDGYDWIADRVTKALTDPKVGALVLRINSPGGDAAGLEEAVRRMRKVADREGKRVIAFADESAASAAYWIAAGVADEVMLPPMGEVGSIGCIGGWVDARRNLEADGYDAHIFRDPPGKAAGSPVAPVAELADERSAESVRAVALTFIGAMAERRPKAGGARAVRALDGAMLTGRAAVDAGLADKVGGFEDAIKLAANAANRRRIDMKNGKALQALGLTDDATDEQIDAAAAQHVLGGLVLERTKQSDPDAALGTVDAWRVSHEHASEERAKLEQQRVAQDATERDALVGRLVASGWEPPAKAWADPELATDASQRKPAEPWASMSLGALRARVETLEAQPRSFGGGEKKATAGGLDERELAICKETGCDPHAFAAMKSARAAGRLV